MSALGIHARPHHVSLSVPDLDRATRFWSDVFGARLLHRFGIAPLAARGAFLDLPGLMLELWELPDAVPQPASRSVPNKDLRLHGIKHLAFLVDDVASALRLAASHGVTIAASQSEAAAPMVDGPPASDPAVFAAFILDPFGHLIELLGPAADAASRGGAHASEHGEGQG